MSIIGGADGPTTIFLSGLIGDFYIIPAFLILIIFYGIYILKLIIQKIQGIQTIHLGKRKEKNIRITEILLSVITYSIVPVQIYCILCNLNIMPAVARTIGIFIGLIGDLIFLISVITMKNNWRVGIPEKDKIEFITNGIYQYSRNPAFLAFDFMYISILLMYFNPLLFLFTILAITVLHLQIIQEEKYLQNLFKDEYINYLKQTNRYFGKKFK